ncbi:UDP-glucose 4-epimerase GalE [Modestobacter sp. I12A-02628]|uniref:UDP-glucose 4-epimerase n=1 Tax=Goekera deserti TaxID=2497753 RepID=A0A7K3WJM9_9ACTN|nr:UDP-glucose 4-epimerase GalE [Goekera deserti]MPR00534.1 UDP-glucose 4-epimerase GalE [Goekera deserti]NDI50470.1 UDP-glucose 4-epimerase GalE [Goekera deserti]NEL56566.1 UDP-glucose 4-epimerase GalE [Goekera deserti]
MTWLVTGGAGYIGSHVVRSMTARGLDVVVLDDLSTGLERRLDDATVVRASLLDESAVREVLARHGVRGIVHLAGKKQVAESVARPMHYYEQNVGGLRRLLAAAADADVGSFVFSSSAAVYGEPDVARVTEDLPCRPVNPYGETKLVGEWMVRDVARATGMAYANLRYFNVVGAADPVLADTAVANLVTQVFARVDAGEPPAVFGGDYDTADGTCVRDFVHVADIASAHVAAASALADGGQRALTLNLGRGEETTVAEVCAVIGTVLAGAGVPTLPPVVTARRPGDPARVVADVRRAESALGWRAERDLVDMVASAWAGWCAHRAEPAADQPEG